MGPHYYIASSPGHTQLFNVHEKSGEWPEDDSNYYNHGSIRFSTCVCEREKGGYFLKCTKLCYHLGSDHELRNI